MILAAQDYVTGYSIMSSVWGMILQWGSTIKVSTELPVATRHLRDMSEKLLKNKQQQYIMSDSNIFRHQQRLSRACAVLPEPSLVTYMISTIISWAGSFYVISMFVGDLTKYNHAIPWFRVERVCRSTYSICQLTNMLVHVSLLTYSMFIEILNVDLLFYLSVYPASLPMRIMCSCSIRTSHSWKMLMV